ncbi:hypothetical protein FRC04_008356 [Tulasnella sp. 424]|nr:hypothetical protein FRC04_008356 [Tulasnella sp. 424]
MESAHLSDAIGQLSYLQTYYWLAAGGATLLIYDWLLCLDREVQYIWRARWSLAKVWFICHRFVKSSTGPSSPEWCRSWDRVNSIGGAVIATAIQGTFVLRVCALYDKSPYIIAFLGATYLACNAVMVASISKVLKTLDYFPNPFTSYHVCVRACNDCIRWAGTSYVPLVVIDVVILPLTVRQSFVTILTASSPCALKGSQRRAAPVLVTFFRDGIAYFTVSFVAALVHILFLLFAPGLMKMWMINYMRPVLSSMATRLLLNLREQVSRTAHYSTEPPTTTNENSTNVLSTVEFASATRAKDEESVAYDVNGGVASSDDGSRPGGHGDEGRGFELKALRDADIEELRSGSGWVESEARLTVPSRRLHGPTNVDAV